MSNDSLKPEPCDGKTPLKTPGTTEGAAKSPFWDLESMRSEDPSCDPNSEEPAALPPTDSNPIPKVFSEIGGANLPRPTARKIDRYGSGTPNYLNPKARNFDETEPTAISGTHQHDETLNPETDSLKNPVEMIARQSFWSYTRTEKIALTGLFLLLITGAVLTVVHFSKRVPTHSPYSEKIEYPVSGNLIEVKSAVTYWRKPVTTGERRDPVRRGTVMLPVVELSLSSKPGAIRVFFCDEEGAIIGDGISRDVEGDQELIIAATAGLDDLGLFAAYRTGENKHWSVQVFEGSSRSADREHFSKILEIEISANQR